MLFTTPSRSLICIYMYIMTTQDERTELDKELSEMQGQLEDDIDTEIENMKRVNEDKLAISRETTLKYKGMLLTLALSCVYC